MHEATLETHRARVGPGRAAVPAAAGAVAGLARGRPRVSPTSTSLRSRTTASVFSRRKMSCDALGISRGRTVVCLPGSAGAPAGGTGHAAMFVGAVSRELSHSTYR